MSTVSRGTNPAFRDAMRLTAAAMLWFFAMLIAAGVFASLSGCAGVSQAVQAYGSVAVTNARAANDTVIEAQKIAFCGLPLSAITRHPEIIPAIRVLCLTPDDKNGAALLDAVAK